MLNRIRQLGNEIRVFLNKNTNKRIIFVGVLTGAANFLMKLLGELDVNMYIYNFVKVSRYTSSQQGGEAHVTFDGVSDADVKGSVVVIVDDIADERITNRCLIDHYLGRGALEVKVCVMLNKFQHKSSAANVKLDWVGYDIPDVFVWGFGLDDSNNPMTRNDHDLCYWGEEIDINGFLYTLPNPMTMSP
jgi:hypoxanthine phosphoribosyltransferase